MLTRKEIRKNARRSLRAHYWIFVAVCLLAAVLGTEYANSTQIFRIQKRVQERMGKSEPTAAEVKGTTSEMSVFNDIVNGDLKGAIESLSHRIEVYQGKDTHIGDLELGHSRGILASVVNTIASGSLLLNILTLIDTMLGAKDIAGMLLALLGFGFIALFWLFVANVYRVGYSRVFLEGRVYKKVPFSRVVFLHRVHKNIRASLSMAVYTLLSYLWIITVVLYPVKRYAYLLTPYLVAENPSLSPLEAIRMSTRMMKGHKWEAFLLEMSILPWLLLSLATGGLAGALFSNPYRETVMAEYCAGIRKLAFENKNPDCEKLMDRYLYEAPPEAVLECAYEDVLELMELPEEKTAPRKGVWGFLEKYLGLVPSMDEHERECRSIMTATRQKEEYQDAVEGNTYPTRLFPMRDFKKNRKLEDAGYLRHYTLTSVILLFFIGCVFGWLWEVALHLLQSGEFANRGTLHGPWLPIYGGGAVLVLLMLYRFRKRHVTEFVLIVVVCGIVEYVTHWILEVTSGGQRWWDYSGYYLNVNGRICAEGLLVFGIAGIAFVYVAAPLLDNFLVNIRMKILVPICAVLLGVFAADIVYSAIVPNTGEGITSVSEGT